MSASKHWNSRPCRGEFDNHVLYSMASCVAPGRNIGLVQENTEVTVLHSITEQEQNESAFGFPGIELRHRSNFDNHA